jgi:hypothetical protein
MQETVSHASVSFHASTSVGLDDPGRQVVAGELVFVHLGRGF